MNVKFFLPKVFFKAFAVPSLNLFLTNFIMNDMSSDDLYLVSIENLFLSSGFNAGFDNGDLY